MSFLNMVQIFLLMLTVVMILWASFLIFKLTKTKIGGSDGSNS